MEFLFFCPEEAIFFLKFSVISQINRILLRHIFIMWTRCFSFRYKNTQQALFSALAITAVYVPAKEWERDEFAVPRCFFCAVDRLPSSGR